MMEIILLRGEISKVSDEDFKELSRYTWYLKDTGYAITFINRKQISLHRFIMNPPLNMQVDHINGDKLDNRRENLRVCTQTENLRNSGINKNNTSGFIGISYDKERKTYNPSITVDCRHINLGRYINIEDALIVRLKAEKKYYGDFAPQRNLFDKYGI
jgi:hypothetical protein